MNNARPRKTDDDDPVMPLEELARRMLAMPVKTRSDMGKKPKTKRRSKK